MPGSASDAVAARLAATAGVQRFPGRELALFVHRDFLDPANCAELIALIDTGRRPSSLVDDLGQPNFRTSETCDLPGYEASVAAANMAIAALLGLDPAFGEPLQGQRYAVGQEFKPHTDSFDPGRADFFSHCADTGQRTWTAMVYLNAVEDGGATRFKTIGKTIQAEPGKLVAWNNLLPGGRPNAATLHQGMKVRKGTKYILTKWFRERPWPTGAR